MFRAMNGAGARAVAVQGPGDQLLAGARLAVDQHRDVAVREAADGAEHLLHGRRLADDLRAPPARRTLLGAGCGCSRAWAGRAP
jgi:hypothetical protein